MSSYKIRNKASLPTYFLSDEAKYIVDIGLFLPNGIQKAAHKF